MTGDYWMLIFTQMSFGVLAAGAFVLSLITYLVGGNKSFALMLSGATFALGLTMFFTYDASGMVVAIFGFIALVIALLKPKARKNSDE